MKFKTLQEFVSFLWDKYHVKLTFHPGVSKDFKSINKGSRTDALALIKRQIEQGPLFIPDGVAQSLHGQLSGYAKIKQTSLNLRVIYKPIKQSGYVEMYVLAIGPRDREMAYQIAAGRL